MLTTILVIIDAAVGAFESYAKITPNPKDDAFATVLRTLVDWVKDWAKTGKPQPFDAVAAKVKSIAGA